MVILQHIMKHLIILLQIINYVNFAIQYIININMIMTYLIWKMSLMIRLCKNNVIFLKRFTYFCLELMHNLQEYLLNNIQFHECSMQSKYYYITMLLALEDEHLVIMHQEYIKYHHYHDTLAYHEM